MASICQLQYFLKLAETPHFVQVAKAEGITQAALSRTIAKLETELGFPLFDRSDRHAVRLTEAGACYAERIRAGLTVLETGEREARLIAGGEAGIFELVLFRGVLQCPVIGAELLKLRRARPGLQLRFREVLTAGELADAVLSFRADAGLLPEDAADGLPESMTTRPAAEFRERLGLLFPPLHPAAELAARENWRNARFILPEPEAGGPASKKFIRYFEKTFGRPPVIAAAADGTEMTRLLVHANLGIGVLPESGAVPASGEVFHPLPVAWTRKILLAERKPHPSPAAETIFHAASPQI